MTKTFKITGTVPGRVHEIGPAGEMYLSRRFMIFRSDDCGVSWKKLWTVPSFGWKPLFVAIRPLARLLRQEVRTFCTLSDGTGIAVTKDGVFRGRPEHDRMEFVMKPADGTPLNIVADDRDRIFFGDYGFHGTKSLYASTDRGRSFEEVYRFPPDEIRHVHGIQYDAYDDVFWVFAGDFGRHAGIARLSSDLADFQWIGKGHQMLRTVQAIVEPDCLYYGSDSGSEKNHIIRLQKASGRWERVRPIDGSSMFASRFGNLRLLTTTVEPSPFCERHSAIYAWTGGNADWIRLQTHEKDRWNARYFQYGVCTLPKNRGTDSRGAYAGQSLKGIDGRTVLFEWESEA